LSAFTATIAGMEKSAGEKAERNKIVKILLTRWIAKQETAEKATLLLLKNPQIRLAKSLKQKAGL
jgi:hypothetical protein